VSGGISGGAMVTASGNLVALNDVGIMQKPYPAQGSCMGASLEYPRSKRIERN
jgi:hypothetical protein